jgi:hypothetical protein
MTMTTAKLKISEFRREIDSLNWSRNDLGGATQQELIKMDVKTRLERHINIVCGMIERVPARFAEDIQSAHKAVEYAQKYIVQWEEKVKSDAEAKSAAKAHELAIRQAPKTFLYLVQ